MNRNLLISLVDKVVRVDRGGPESRIGKLLTAGEDHFVLLTEKDGIVYYKTQHIKSITVNSRDGMEFKVDDPEDDSYLLPTNFKTVVSNFLHQWVKVNRGGPEMLEGIMEEVTDDYITIFSKDEIIRLAMYHVRNISLGTSKKEEENKNEGNNETTNNNTTNNNSVNNKGRNARNRKR
ncbi:hypothetical protein AB1J28_11690 [Lysinibacillus irui]|uniref:hypothetical protein n=1 Tax=Lysinibacillus irui TaxID=2998077 RepID=UPI003D28A1D1